MQPGRLRPRRRDLPGAGQKRKKLRVIGVSLAGKPFTGEVGEGRCVRIMTGAVMPAGTDSVVIQERVEPAADGDSDAVIVSAGEKPGANVRRAGEDLQVGAVAIAAGRRFTPSHLGLAASLGFAELPVVRRPRVAFFSNGDELRAVGRPLASGELYDSNRYTLYGMLSELGVEMVDMGIVPDDPAAVGAALAQGAACADVVITTAGASAGEADYIRETLERLGEVIFHKVAIKPGRPMAFGKLGDSLFFGLPGQSGVGDGDLRDFCQTGASATGRGVRRRAVAHQSQNHNPPQKTPGPAEYQRGVLAVGAGATDGVMVVRSTGDQGSGILSSMGEANCFIILPTDSEGVAAGEMVEVQPRG